MAYEECNDGDSACNCSDARSTILLFLATIGTGRKGCTIKHWKTIHERNIDVEIAIRTAKSCAKIQLESKRGKERRDTERIWKVLDLGPME